MIIQKFTSEFSALPLNCSGETIPSFGFKMLERKTIVNTDHFNVEQKIEC